MRSWIIAAAVRACAWSRTVTPRHNVASSGRLPAALRCAATMAAATRRRAGTCALSPGQRRTAACPARRQPPRPRARQRHAPGPPAARSRCARLGRTLLTGRIAAWRVLRWLILRWLILPGALHRATEDLAGRALGQLGHQPHLTRVLVGGDPLLHERPQLVRGRGRSRLDRDGGADLLAQLVMGDPDDSGLGDRRVLVQDLLDLARVDVVAAANDQLLLAVHDEEVAVLVHPGEVTRAEPAVRDRLGRRLGLPPVALHHVVPADRDLADLAGRAVGAVGAGQAHLEAGHRRTDRAWLAVSVRVVERGDRGSL